MKLRLIALLSAVACPFGAVASDSALILETKSHVVVLVEHCPEGDVACNDITYVGVSKKSGDSIRLKGKSVHSMGSDGVTPSRFLGYSFINGQTKYFIENDGTLSISQKGRVSTEQKGIWKN